MSNKNENKIHTMWPIYIGEFFNPEHEEIKDDLIEFFKEYEKKNPKSRINKTGDPVENYNLYESQYNLHQEKNPAFEKLLNFISMGFITMSNNANKASLKNLDNKDPKFNVKLTETWFIRYEKGGVVFPHNHQNCSWCCVYYVQIGKDSKEKNGSTYFLKPYTSANSTDFGGANYTYYGTSVIKGDEGKLVIWPNFLYHGSHPYSGDKNRIIVSANASINLNKVK